MQRVCVICGKLFETKSSRRTYCYDEHYHPCPICGKPVLTKDPYHLSENCDLHSKMPRQKTCALCGDLFFPKTSRQTVCDKQHYRPCPVCNVLLPINRPSDPVRCCSKSCTEKRRKQRCFEKYGVDHPMQLESVKQTYRESMVKIYGVESPLQSAEIKKKAIESNQKKFGADWALANPDFYDSSRIAMIKQYGNAYTLQCPELVQRVIDTMNERYGHSYPTQCPEIQHKIEHTCLHRYGVSNPMKNPEILEKAIANRILHNGAFYTTSMKRKAECTWMKSLGVRNPSFSKEVIAKIANTLFIRYGVKTPMHIPEVQQKVIATTQARYGVPFYVVSKDYLSKCGHIRISSVNKKFARKLEANNIDYSFEYVLDSKSFDICIPHKKILVELNPTYTHNTVGNHWCKSGISSSYHLEKSMVAWKYGFRCIHIFDWDNQFEILNLLLDRSKLYARDCVLKSISQSDADTFMDCNHLQGKCRGQIANYGLFYKGELVQAMTFGVPRYNSSYQWELLRLCTVPEFYVVGGAERLFLHFCKDNNPKSIISYCDLSKFSGNVYNRLNFIHHHNTSPNKVWSNGTNKITNNLLLQRGFDQLFHTNFGKGTSNEQLMLDSGWLPVYDCGQAVYIWNKS